MGLDSEMSGMSSKSGSHRSALHFFTKWMRPNSRSQDNLVKENSLDKSRRESRREQFLSRFVRQAQMRIDAVTNRGRKADQHGADPTRRPQGEPRMLHIAIDSAPVMLESGSHPNLLSVSQSPPIMEGNEVDDVYTELEALHLSRQDNPVLLQLASQEHLDEPLGRSTASLYCGLSPSLSPCSHLMQTCMVRSPPPVSWPMSNEMVSISSSEDVLDATNIYARSTSEETILNSPSHFSKHIVINSGNGNYSNNNARKAEASCMLSPSSSVEPRRNYCQRGMSCSMTQAEPVIRRNHSCQRDRRNSTSSTSVWRLNFRGTSRCGAKSVDDLDEGSQLSPPNSLSPPPSFMTNPNMMISCNNNNALFNRSISPIPGPTLFTKIKCLPLT